MRCTSQVADFFLKIFPWAQTGADPDSAGPSNIGMFPMPANDQRDCIKGIVTREGAGHGVNKLVQFHCAQCAIDNPASGGDVMLSVASAKSCMTTRRMECGHDLKGRVKQPGRAYLRAATQVA